MLRTLPRLGAVRRSKTLVQGALTAPRGRLYGSRLRATLDTGREVPVVGLLGLQGKDVTGLWASSAPESLHASGAEAATRHSFVRHDLLVMPPRERRSYEQVANRDASGGGHRNAHAGVRGSNGLGNVRCALLLGHGQRRRQRRAAGELGRGRRR